MSDRQTARCPALMTILVTTEVIEKNPTKHSTLKLFVRKPETTNLFHYLSQKTQSTTRLSAGGVRPKCKQMTHPSMVGALARYTSYNKEQTVAGNHWCSYILFSQVNDSNSNGGKGGRKKTFFIFYYVAILCRLLMNDKLSQLRYY